MYEFWQDYVKLKYGEKAKLYYMDTDSFIVYIKTDNIYKDIAEDVETRFDTSNYGLNKPLPKGKNKKVIGVMNNELDVKIMKEFLGLREKSYNSLIDDGSEDKNTKGCHKKQLKFQGYKNCLEATQLENRINHLEKNVLKYIISKKIIKNS